MANRHSQRRPQDRRPRRPLTRADLAILACGVLASLGLTFGAPLLEHGLPSAGVDAVAAGPATGVPVPAATPTAAPQSTTPAPTSTGQTAQAQTTPTQTTPAAAAKTPVAPALTLPEASAPVRISYPAANFDVPVHPLEPDAAAQATQTIVPPETKDAYWLTPYGIPGRTSANTTYVIGHSWDGADAPFNHLSSSAHVGDRFTVETAAGTITYRVDSVDTYLKSSLKDSPIWDMVPNRLVLISCFTQDPWGKNVVVTASPAAP